MQHFSDLYLSFTILLLSTLQIKTNKNVINKYENGYIYVVDITVPAFCPHHCKETVFLIQGLVVGLLDVLGKVISSLTEAGYYRILEPVIICLIRVTAGISNILQPILNIVGQIMQHLAHLILAFQPINITNLNRDGIARNL